MLVPELIRIRVRTKVAVYSISDTCLKIYVPAASVLRGEKSLRQSERGRCRVISAKQRTRTLRGQGV